MPDGTTLHYAVASTEAKLVFSDREATHAPAFVWIFWKSGIILGVAKWSVVRFSNGLCFRVLDRAIGWKQILCFRVLDRAIGWKQIRNTNIRAKKNPAFRSNLTLNSWSREKDFFDGEIRHTIRRRATRPKARARAPNHLHIPPLPTDSPAVHDARRRDPDATHTVTRSRSHFICDTAVFDAQESSGER